MNSGDFATTGTRKQGDAGSLPASLRNLGMAMDLQYFTGGFTGGSALSSWDLNKLYLGSHANDWYDS